MSIRVALLSIAFISVVSLSHAPYAFAAEHAPGRVLVKLVPAVVGDVAAAARDGRAIEGTPSGSRLDVVFRFVGVRTARRVFAPAAGTYGDARAIIDARARRARGPRARAGSSPTKLPDLANVFLLELSPDADVAAAVQVLSADPAVVVAQPDHFGDALFTPDDPRFTCAGAPCAPGAWQWALHRIRAPEAWDRARGDGIVIAIIDSGVNRGHLDLAANMWTNTGEALNGVDDDGNGFVDDLLGWDFVECNAYTSQGGPGGTCVEPNADGDNDPRDDNGHGTAVAGVAGAVTDNALDMAAVAPDAQIMAVRAVNRQSRSVDSELLPAIMYAADNGADVITLSLVTPGTELLHDAIQYADALGVLLVAAAGNSGDQRTFFPAGFPEVIAVAATDIDDAHSTFSTFGPKIELAAPGEQVLSLLGLTDGASGVHGGLDGTSMAAPHVAGVAALLWSWNPALTAEQVRTALCEGAVDLGLPGRDPFFGCGRIDAAATLGTQCVQGICGDAIVEPACGEQCDDGNTAGGDCCSASCAIEGFGGDCALATRGVRKCQTALASRAAKLGALWQRELQRCLDKLLAELAAGRGTVRALPYCAKRVDPSVPGSPLSRARAAATAQMAKACAGAAPAALGSPCNGSADTMDEVIACVVEAHIASAQRLVAQAYRDACAMLRVVGLDAAHPHVCTAG